MKILLDSGHGKGENRGSLIGNEGDNTFYYALVLKEVLEAYGVTVGLTRNKLEDNPTLEKRGTMANGYDLLLSLHSNAYSDKNVNGIELWDSVQKPNKDLATKLVNELATHFRANRGVKYKELAKGQDWYGILRASQATHAMLIEHGFHTNLEDVKVFTEKRKELAETTAKVIADYYKLDKVEDKPVENKPATNNKNVAKIKTSAKYKSKSALYNGKAVPKGYTNVYMEYELNKVKGEDWVYFPKIDSYVAAKDVIVLDANIPAAKEKWLRIPTTISTYRYYDPKQANKTKAYAKGILRPINYKHQAKFIEYKVIAEKGDFKTIQLNGDKANPLIDIFTGKGTEHAWETFYK